MLLVTARVKFFFFDKLTTKNSFCKKNPFYLLHPFKVLDDAAHEFNGQTILPNSVDISNKFWSILVLICEYFLMLN